MKHRYIIVPPASTGGERWWRIVFADGFTIGPHTMVLIDTDFPQAEMWIKLIADQVNRGRPN